MKLSIATLLILPALTAAFMPAQPRAFRTSLEAAPKTKEEDLELTRKVIATFFGDAPEEEEEPAAEEEAAEEAAEE